MKNRKTVVVAFLLVAAMLLGVGYAALQDTLTIDGVLGADISTANTQFDHDIYFEKHVISDPALATVGYADNMRDEATITAKAFQKEGDTVTITFTIINKSVEFDALVTPDVLVEALTVTPANGEHDPVFTATWKWADGTNGAQTIANNDGTMDVSVTITLTETPTEAHEASFTLNFNAESVG